MPIGAYLARKVHPKIIIGGIGIIGPIFLWISSFMPTFYSWWACWLITYAVVNSLTYLTPIHHSWLWFKDNCGLASGVIMGGYGLSGLVFNTVALDLFNPEHLDADLVTGLFPPSV